MKCVFSLGLMSFALMFHGCTEPSDKVNFKKLISKYSINQSDSLKLQATIFIQENIKSILSEKLEFYDDFGEVVNFNPLAGISDDALLKIMEKKKLNSRSVNIADSKILTTELLALNIDKAISDWKKYPWSKDIPKDIFFNYVLPYKILNEIPQDWRGYFSRKYADSIDMFAKERITNTEHMYKSIIQGTNWSFKYDDEYLPIMRNPSLSDLLRVNKGGCFRMSCLNVYILRALGIPSTIDIVPLWGDRSGSHASDVFYRNTSTEVKKQDLKPMVGNGFVRPPKVFRYSFKKTNLWTDSILPVLSGNRSFLLNFLRSDHLLDVTNEYVSTVDLVYPLNVGYGEKLAYICVYNNERWQPLFYGKINSKNRSVIFNDMASNMLYHIAVPDKNTFKLIDEPFLVDSLGAIKYSTPDFKNLGTLKLEKTNTAEKACVKANHLYELYILYKNGERKLLQTKLCQKDSAIEFNNVPKNSFFMLVDKHHGNKSSRYFLYKNGIQVWY